MKRLFFVASIWLSSSLLGLWAGDSNGIIAIPYESDKVIVLVDTNSKKMLLYTVSPSKGFSLKEVRSFEDVLQAPNFISSRGISGKTEKKELSGILK